MFVVIEKYNNVLAVSEIRLFEPIVFDEVAQAVFVKAPKVFVIEFMVFGHHLIE